MLALCGALYADPADPRSVDKWSQKLGMSSRTLTRRFEHEVGMTMRTWRLRLFKAIELLGGGLAITQIAPDLGYASSSAFTYEELNTESFLKQLQLRTHGRWRQVHVVSRCSDRAAMMQCKKSTQNCRTSCHFGIGVFRTATEQQAMPHKRAKMIRCQIGS